MLDEEYNYLLYKLLYINMYRNPNITSRYPRRGTPNFRLREFSKDFLFGGEGRGGGGGAYPGHVVLRIRYNQTCQGSGIGMELFGGLIFGPGFFWVLRFAPIRSSPSLEKISNTPLGSLYNEHHKWRLGMTFFIIVRYSGTYFSQTPAPAGPRYIGITHTLPDDPPYKYKREIYHSFLQDV